MANGITYEGVPVADGEAADGAPKLFSGMKFWLSFSIPQRQWLLQNARTNGADIVALETQADYCFVDHTRKNQAPGTYSYRFIELSIRNGQVENIDDHAVGVSARVHRPVGSTVTAPKKSRNAFTDAEDQWLWDMIKPYVDNDGSWKGNEIYKQLESLDSRHTFQSWRDRWIKYVQHQNREIKEDHNLQGIMGEASARPPASIVQDTEGPELRPSIVQASHASPVTHQAPATTGLPSARKRRKLTPPEGDADTASRSASISPRKLASRFSPHRRPVTPKSRSASPIKSSPMPAETPDGARTPGVSRDPVIFSQAELGQFTARQASQLYQATRYILDTPEADREEAWKLFAESEEWKVSGHSVDDWKAFHIRVMLPKYRSRRRAHPVEGADPTEPGPEERTKDIQPSDGGQDEAQAGFTQGSEAQSIPYEMTCFKCCTTESTRWRHNRKGRSLCDECGKFSQKIGVLRQSTALVQSIEDGEASDEVDSEVYTQAEEEDAENIQTDDKLAETSLPDPMGTNGVLERRKEVRKEESSRDIQTSQEYAAEKSKLPRLAAPSQTFPSLTPGRTKMVDTAVGTSPVLASAQFTRPREGSPTYEPISPTVSRAPGPNEARKRSAMRSQSTSQETAKTTAEQIDGGEEKDVEVTKTPPKSLKRKRLFDNPHSLAIPPTPEHVEHDIDSLGLAVAQSHSPELPRNRSFIRQRSPKPRNLMFLSDESDDDQEHEEALVPSDPLDVKLFSDQPDLPAQPNDEDYSDAEVASEYGFETAQETSYDWETAPETPRKPNEVAETQPQIKDTIIIDLTEETDAPMMNQPDKTKGRIETQASFEIANVGGMIEEDFDLPAPEGGWEMLELPKGQAEQDQQVNDVLAQSIGSDDVEEEEHSSSEPELPGWMAKHLSQHPKINAHWVERMLQAAIESTSMDYDLADAAFGEMMKMYKNGTAKRMIEEGGVMLPENMIGCFTYKDDSLLFEGPGGIERTRKKHGFDRCKERLDFLQMMDDS